MQQAMLPNPITLSVSHPKLKGEKKPFEVTHSSQRESKIQVKCSCGEEKCPEWAILELQGVIEVQPSFKDSLQNLRIGTLCRPTSQESYTFTAGYHELTGTKVPLKKPVLVLKKIKLSTEEEKGDINSSRVELDVIGVIRQRILFKTRPKALISKKIGTVVKATNISVEYSYWPSLFAKLFEKKDIEDRILNVGAGGGPAVVVAAAPVAGGGVPLLLQSLRRKGYDRGG